MNVKPLIEQARQLAAESGHTVSVTIHVTPPELAVAGDTEDGARESEDEETPSGQSVTDQLLPGSTRL